jgi:hypothetical protein
MIRPTGSVVFWRRTLPVKAAGGSGFAGRHLRVRRNRPIGTALPTFMEYRVC